MTQNPTTIEALCHQWKIVRAKLDLDILERGHEQETIEFLHGPARDRFREIEMAILATDPVTIGDGDLVAMLRLAREVIGNDDFDDEQEQRCHQMLELIDTTLTRRIIMAQPRLRVV